MPHSELPASPRCQTTPMHHLTVYFVLHLWLLGSLIGLVRACVRTYESRRKKTDLVGNMRLGVHAWVFFSRGGSGSLAFFCTAMLCMQARTLIIARRGCRGRGVAQLSAPYLASALPLRSRARTTTCQPSANSGTGDQAIVTLDFRPF